MSDQILIDRGFFAEQLESAKLAERESIIKLLEEQMIQGSYRDWLIALIKGENK